jgi:hypothetical protein
MMPSVTLFLNFKEMKKKIVTYGVRGMIEYQALIKLGQVSFKVTFEGGSMTELGVVPATFTTKNFLVQQAIEMSPQYKKGLIKKEKELETDEDLEVAPATKSEEGRGKSEENSELRGETIEADNGGMSAEGSLVFEFRMPGNYADGATAELCEGMHEYLKDVAISDWYGVTNPADSERYMVLASSALQGVVAALGSRLRPMRRKEGSV